VKPDISPTMKTSPIKRCSIMLLAGIALFALAVPAAAQQVSREQDIVGLRLGQRVKVDDGTCPAGQVKEVSGTKMTSAGIVASKKCIPRVKPKSKDVPQR
jgi:hypothetical protein